MSTYKDSRGRWRYRFSFKGRRYKGSAPKERNLERVATALEKQHLERLVARIYTGEMPTVSAFVVRFLDHQKARVKPLTHENQTIHLKKHVEAKLGKKRLDALDTAELANLVTGWKLEGAAVRTINARIDTLNRMFGLAVEWKMIAAPPDIARLKVPKDAPRFLSEPEASALLEAADSKHHQRSDALEWRSMVLIGLRTGLRIGELRGLQWRDVDLVRAVVHVRRTDPGRPNMDPTDPKSGKDRVVPLTPDALVCLRERLEWERARLGPAWNLELWVWPGALTWRGRKRNTLATRAESVCKHAIDKFAKRAGLRDVGWHTLRHTFASWLVMRNVPLRSVQELLGHASIKMTERYAHLAPGFVNHATVSGLDLPLLHVGKPPALLPGDENDEE